MARGGSGHWLVGWRNASGSSVAGAKRTEEAVGGYRGSQCLFPKRALWIDGPDMNQSPQVLLNVLSLCENLTFYLILSREQVELFKSILFKHNSTDNHSFHKYVQGLLLCYKHCLRSLYKVSLKTRDFLLSKQI